MLTVYEEELSAKVTFILYIFFYAIPNLCVSYIPIYFDKYNAFTIIQKYIP